MLHIIIWGMFNRPLALVLLAIYIFYAIFTLIMSIVQVLVTCSLHVLRHLHPHHEYRAGTRYMFVTSSTPSSPS